jgi:hypothetical protein
MGGSKKRGARLSNQLVLCSWANNAIEADPEWQARALEFGWKISTWADPLTVPVRDAAGVWWLLDDFGGRYLADAPEKVF